MTELLVVIVTALVVIAAATVVGPRLGIASPLVLVAVGVAASFLPMFTSVHIEPEWIIEGLLPPLLYSSAVSMPTMNFRREFGAISGLSVLLVVGSALLLGLFFTLVVPGLSFAWGVALGAIISPTDAVATSIIKQMPVSKRAVAILDGESLLNDATALVLLRTAIVATAASFALWGAVGTFVYSVVVAVVVGWAVGRLNLVVRRRVTDPTVNTVISFTVPFAAAVPVELLGASGLVAAVVAGLVTGIRAPRDLSPQNRLSDSQNWRTVELVLEGAVFLTMGVQIKSIVTNVENDHAGVGAAVLVAAGALLLTILVRAAYVAPLLVVLARWARRIAKMQGRMQDMQDRMSTPEGKQETFEEMNSRRRKVSERDLDRFARRVTQSLADIDYFLAKPLGWREGTVVVWAGMRGAVTVAAAQSLPDDTPQRSVLVLIAFAVATMSLLVQGATIGPLLRLITPKVDQAAIDESATAERARIMELLRESAETVPEPPHPADEARPEGFARAKSHRLAVIAAQRSVLLDARDNGTFDADVLANALANLDASQIAIEMRGKPVG
ncbi:CPA1 family monovalent cation:H+ antiporter [Allocatelliglobosispora scoriae]|uniref:CPA1 family monovalent cation:H+ antiporter n=1 Tax=Allocatelliglobosispora scoriae TaxID=643052 RepID=A0A841C1B1_9ACTN|nr:sodium:proton antiporter [Allocatelliglobosispora scoriae]MBB5873715.1 CPA1 family monovalent cation:H+ antiporter [Allocatelliglobosispora scoriae]